MGLSVMIALIMLFVNTTILAAEQKTITVPFPRANIDSRADNFFCNGTLGTVLQGDSGKSDLGMGKAGIFAKAYHASSDRMVVEISAGKLYMFNRDEFESGKTTRDFPLEIVENSETNLVAVAYGLIKPKTVTIFTLNRKTGIGSWTVVNSINIPLSDSPRIDAIYMTCGGRKD
jgi:hypothetical protein